MLVKTCDDGAPARPWTPTEGGRNDLGVHPGCLENWDYGRKKPADRFYPAIIRFLGFNPLPEAVSLGGSIRRERISRDGLEPVWLR
jgi:hypothetical protein